MHPTHSDSHAGTLLKSSSCFSHPPHIHIHGGKGHPQKGWAISQTKRPTYYHALPGFPKQLEPNRVMALIRQVTVSI